MAICDWIIFKKEHIEQLAFFVLKPDFFGQSSVIDLVEALKWCLRHGAGLISLSLGTTIHSTGNELSDIVREIKERGIILVASACNEKLLTYPACFNFCIGVSVDYTEIIKKASFSYQEITIDGIDVIISPYTKFGEYIGNNSMATAYLAGILSVNLLYESEASTWLKNNSAPFPTRNDYRYIKDGILNMSKNDTIVVAISEDELSGGNILKNEMRSCFNANRDALRNQRANLRQELFRADI